MYSKNENKVIKKIVKRVPLIGIIAKKINRRLKGISSFKTSGKYWEELYQKGGNSGEGSYNNLAEFKAEVINSFVKENNILRVIEFGCGDGNQLKFFDFDSYLGYDVSPSAISICVELFKNDATKQFKVIDSEINETADLTLSLDVIYHLIEEDTYQKYMERLFKHSNRFVIIYSSNFNEPEITRAVQHVKHRKFEDWVKNREPKFKLVKYIPNKYPYNGDFNISSFADFYIYEKQDNNNTNMVNVQKDEENNLKI